ncbi:condensation domain-containing protein [Psychrobacter alimentarius]|uniref:condensation domain-containing protein n=1 Tax=Psychrobacter alimentarius TaxID=261164 RepID=UPI003FD0B793
MLQLQQPEQVIRHSGAWRLSSDIDEVVLRQAIKDTIEEIPDLNVRYRFSDDGDLYKYQYEQPECCLQTASVAATDIPNYMSKLKDMPWNAALNPPFNSFIVHTECDTVLILELHPILDQAHHLTDITGVIKNHYHQRMPQDATLSWTAIEAPVSTPSTQKSASEQAQNQEALTAIILGEFRAALAEPEMTAVDDFFDYGGHSLLATRIIGKLAQSHGIDIGFNDFFKSPSATALAEHVSVNTTDHTTETPTAANDAAVFQEQAPLTLAQQFLWHAYTAYEFSPIYNLPFAVAFSEAVDEQILYQAFSDIIKRHASLRTTFHTQNDVTIQRIVPVSELNQYQWFWSSEDSQGVTLTDEADYQFDLASELPLRIRFLQSPASESQVLSLLIHHMVIDEWSLNTIMADLSQAYLSRALHQEPQWDTSAGNINDFALLQQQQGINQQHVNYWTNRLRDAPKGFSPPDSSDSATITPYEISTNAQCIELDLGTEAYKTISAFARQHGSSLFGVIYTAIALSLHKQSGLDDIVIGTSASGRTDAEFFDTVGYFTTMVAHRIQFDTEQSVESLLNDITFTINDSMRYADIPIDIIQKSLGMSPTDGLLFDVYIHIHSNNALNGTLTDPNNKALHYQQIPPKKDISMFGLHFEIMDDVFEEDQHALRIVTTYQNDRYSTASVESICDKISQILEILNTTNGSHYPLGQVLL